VKAQNLSAPLLTSDQFRELLHRHQSMVYSIAVRVVGDRAAAEELAQDVFLELHDQLARLDSEAHVLHWLRRVTVHRAIDYLRRRNRWTEFSVDDPDFAAEHGWRPEMAVEPEVGDPLLSRQLRQLVDSLPAAPRTVIVLRYQEDLMPEEIASLLSMPVATVKSHLQRALRLLREKAARVLR
jgi:RNA polymerase sigma-70 factor (ECF subfamily)